jgi:5'-nucleotidase
MSPRPRHTTPRAVALVAGLAVLLGPLVPAAASAAPGDTGVVIAEVYAKGGSANAPFTNKFAELSNPTTASVSLAGWSLQYRSATGAGAFTAADLSGAIAPGGHYLVQMSSNGSTGAALPTPDAVTTLNPAGASGVLVLSDAAAPLTLPAGSVSSATPGVVDALGWGVASVFETSAAELGSANGTPTSYVRADGADTDVNSVDFTQQSQVTPQNSGGGGTTPTDPVPVPDPVSEADVTIAELQGTTDVSPWAGRTVTTSGVVTATYPTGGLNGYVIQTPGTGGVLDPGAHVASDAVFVYSASTVGSVELGDHVEVVGAVSEFNGLTQVAVTGASSLTVLDEAAAAPLPATVGFPAGDAQRESLESMLVLPQGEFTVADTYTTNQYGEVKLAVGDRPLIQPTEVALPGSAEAAAVAADNAARAVTLDDGQSTAFFTNQSAPVSYLSNEDPVTVGAAVAFTKPVVLEYRNGVWKYQPTTTVTGETPYADLPVTFEDIRTDAPLEVGGDVTLASFNVLNYFTTTGDSIPGCTFYRDRAGAPLTVNSGCDARGAANAESLARQQVKIVTAINALGADVVSLEEIENSARFGKDRDDALRTLVGALNTAAGSDVWGLVPSPAPEARPANEDVIRLAFIYKKAAVEMTGQSTILTGSAAFSNARQPLSQAFRPVGGDAGSTFLAIANHFKSKGSGTGPDADAGDGQGGSNGSRINQANALVAFAAEREAAAGTDKVFLLGDFNAYSMEDPIEVLRAAGYVDLGSTETDEYSYVFSGLSGSLDHVLASPAAAEVVTGVDIWNINSGEGIGLEYSRFNNNVRQLYQPDQFRSSDHDPVVVGVDLLADVIEPTDPTQPADPGAPTQPGQPADPAAPAAPGGAVPAGQGSATADGLAFTGSDSIAAWVALALGLLTAGGTLLVRRRRASSGA